jgi:hypothetical protein
VARLIFAGGMPGCGKQIVTGEFKTVLYEKIAHPVLRITQNA